MSALKDLLNRYNEGDAMTNLETLIITARDETAAEELAALRQAQAERDALKDALRPFAKEGEGLWNKHPDGMPLFMDNYDPTEEQNYGKSELTIGDFRKAAAALKGDE